MSRATDSAVAEPHLPPFFAKALKDNKKAAAFFASLAPTYQREYLVWVSTAKREETREQRLAIADDVIDNSGSLEALDAQVDALHRHYIELAELRADTRSGS